MRFLVLTVLAVALFATVQAQNVIECKACETIIKSVEGWVASNKTETQIEQDLERLCDLLPKSYRATCDKIIVKGVDEIITLLEKKWTPERICQSFGMCAAVNQKVTGIECEACEVVVNAIEKWVADGKTEAEIEKLLEELCNLLPKSFRVACDMIVEKGISTIIALLEKKWPAERICAAMNMCATVQLDAMFLVETTARDLLAQKLSIAEVKLHVEELCKSIPEQYQVECMTFAKRTNYVMLQHYAQTQVARGLGSDLACDMCIKVMQGFKAWLKDNVDQKIDEAIDKLCGKMGDTIKMICKSLTGKLVDKIKDYINNKITAQEMCSMIELCTQ